MKLFNYTDSYAVCKVRVEIIGESSKSYHVKLLQRGPLGQQIGTTYWPRKRNVINITEVGVLPDIRLPYKD
jgi:hypothetical protein